MTIGFQAGGTFVTIPFNGLLFSNLDFGPEYVIGSVALDTDLAGMNLSRIDFGDDFVRVNLAGIWFANGQSLALSFGLAPAAVPAPAAIGLLGLGLAGLALHRRR